jgi:putative ABC transport system permease protein
VVLTVSFAASTSVFNTTYGHQAALDARLTNGADVNVTESPGSTVGPDGAGPLSAVAGVGNVEPLQHRFAYVGADLQDLYGVRPATIGSVAGLQDAYFAGGTAGQLLGRLASAPDSILVSEETVRDFQLRPGDTVTLRLQDGRTKALTPVTFHYAGVVREFPTAPRDSFLVANADYVARMTGSDAVGAFLIDAGSGASPASVAARVRAALGPTVTVTDIATSRRIVGSSLTAVDLRGLTRVELGFALVLAAASAGLVLALGLAERRRLFAIAGALGATPRQLQGFVWAESGFVLVGGLVAGGVAGLALSELLVGVLGGVFDPPPASLAVPWAYLAVTAAVTVVAVGLAGRAINRSTGPAAVGLLRVP